MAAATSALSAVTTELAAARAEIVELKAKLGKNSKNSSKPPSTDMPGTRQPKAKSGKRRKRGGQPGHAGRFAAAPDHVDYVKQHRPLKCKHCRSSLARGTPEGTVVNHYVYELPEIRPIVTDHQCVDMKCADCGLVTQAELPAGVPTGQYGPSVQAMTALLRGEMRQSVRQTSAVMSKLMHVPMSTGMVAKTQDQVSRALEQPFEEALDHAQRSDRAHADETGWRENKKRAWLWVSVTALVTVYLIRIGRAKQSAKDLLGENFNGIMITSRWNAYNWVVSGMCRAMLKFKEAFFTFIDHDGVEPTNNVAERAVRFAVLMRKLCFGSDSEKGSRFIERFLTARATLRAQNRDLYTYLKDACTADLCGTAAPSLLPEHARDQSSAAAVA